MATKKTTPKKTAAKPKTASTSKKVEVVSKPNRPQSMDGKFLIVIPYYAAGAQGRELEYAIEGWRRHFKNTYHIAVVGDYHPVVDSGDDITFIECPRVDGIEGQYRPHIDIVNKFSKAHDVFPDTLGFVYVADDVYAVNDFDMGDIMYLKQNGSNLNWSKDGNTSWGREKAKTHKVLSENGYPTRNFTTHLPVWFDWDRLEALFDKFDMAHNSYIIETMYFNVYFPNRIPLQLDFEKDNLKCGVYRPKPRLDLIAKAFDTKIWIQNSVDGWIPQLDKMLAEYYGL